MTGNNRLECRPIVLDQCQSRGDDNDSMGGIVHVKNIVEKADRHLGNRTIHLDDATIEYTGDSRYGGCERSTPTAAQYRQFITNTDPQVSREDRANDYLLRIAVIGETSLADQTGNRRNARLIGRINAKYLDAVTTIITRCKRERGRPDGDCLEGSSLANLRCEISVANLRCESFVRRFAF